MTRGWPPYMEMVMLSEEPTLSTADRDILKAPEKEKIAIQIYEFDGVPQIRLVCGTCLITMTEQFNEGYCECQFCRERVGLEYLVRLLQGAGDKITDLLNLLSEYLPSEK